MSFPKAPVKRYYDVQNGVPGPGKYDPNIPNQHIPGGVLFDKSKRFPEEKEGFAIPRTPSFRKVLGHSQSRPLTASTPRSGPSNALKGRKSNSYSLPSEINHVGLEIEPNETQTFEIRRNLDIDSLISEIHNKELELEEKSKLLHIAETKIRELTGNFSGVETRLIELVDKVEEKDVEIESLTRNYNNAIETMLADRNALEEEVSHLRIRSESLEETTKSQDVQLQETTAKAQELKMEVESHKQQCSELNRTLENVRHELAATLQSNTKLETELEVAMSNLKETTELANDWKDKYEDLSEQYQHVSHSLSHSHQCLSSLELHVQELKDSLTALNLTESHLKNCQKELKSALQYINEQEVNIAQKDNELMTNESRITHLSKAVADRDTQIKILEELISVKDEEIGNLRCKVNTERETASLLERSLESLRNEKTKVERKLSDNLEVLKGTKDVIQKELTQRIKELENENEQMQVDLSESIRLAEETNQQMEADFAKRLECVEEGHRKIQNALREKLTQVQEEKNSCESELTQKVALISAEKSASEVDLSNRLSQLETVRESMEAQYAHNVQIMNDEKERLQRDYKHQLRTLEEELAKKQLEFDERFVTVQSEKMQAENELRKRLTDEMASIEISLAKQIQALETEKINLETELSERVISLETDKLRLEADYTERFEELRNDKAECEMYLQAQINDLELQKEELQSDLLRLKRDFESELSIKSALLAAEQSKVADLIQVSAEIERSMENERVNYENEQNRNAKKLEDYEMQVAALEIEIERLQHDLDETHKAMDQKEVESNTKLGLLEKIIAEAEINQQNLQTLLTEKSAILELFQNDLVIAKSELNSKSLAIEKTQQELEERNAQILQFTEAMKANENELEDAKARLEIAEAKIEVTETEVQELQQLLEQEKGLREQRCQEYETKVTASAIEIAELKDNLDIIQCQRNQLEVVLCETRQASEVCRKELETTKLELAQERNNYSDVQNEWNEKLTSKEQELALANANALKLKKLYDDLCLEREKQALRLTNAHSKLGDYLNDQLNRSNKKVDAAVKATFLQSKLEHLRKMSNTKVAKSQEKIKELAVLSLHYKSQMEDKARKLSTELQSKSKYEGELDERNTQIENLKTQNATLESLIGPFREQLKHYKTYLDLEQGATAKYAEYAADLESRMAKTMGHQNPKQRIQHLQKLKDEKLALLNQNQQLQKDLSYKSKRIKDLEEKLTKVSRRFDPSDAFKHVMKDQRQLDDCAENIPPRY